MRLNKIDGQLILHLNQKYFNQKNLLLVFENYVNHRQIKLYVNKPRTSYKILFEGKTYNQCNDFLNGLNQSLIELK